MQKQALATLSSFLDNVKQFWPDGITSSLLSNLAFHITIRKKVIYLIQVHLQIVRFMVLAGDVGERPGLEEVEPLAEVNVVIVDEEVGEGGVGEEVGPVRQLQLPPRRSHLEGILRILFDCSAKEDIITGVIIPVKGTSRIIAAKRKRILL